MKWMHKVLAVLLAMSMLMTGFVFAEGTEEEHTHNEVIEQVNEESEPATKEEEITTTDEEVVEEETTTTDEEVVEEETTTEDEEVVEEETTTEDEEVVEEETTTEDEEVVEEETTTTEDEEVVEEETTAEDEEVVEEETTTTEDEEVVEEETTAEDEEVVEKETTTTDEEVVEEENTTEDEEVVEEETTTEDEEVVGEETTTEGEEDIVLEFAETSTVMMLSAVPAAETECSHYDDDYDCVCDECDEEYHEISYWCQFGPESECSYTAVNDAYHNKTGKIYSYRGCTGCGEVYEQSFVEDRTAKGEHAYSEDGVCEQCGHTRPADCSNGHSLETRTCSCVVCGETFHNFGENGCVCSVCGSEAGHSFVDCVCTKCGEANHEGWDPDNCYCEICGKTAHMQWPTYVFVGEVSYKDVSEHYHETTGTYQNVVKCSQCGILLSEGDTYEGMMVDEGHDYENGVCACGRIEPEYKDSERCDHEETITDTIWKNCVITKVTTQKHSFVYDLYEVVSCKTCGMDISTQLLQAGVTEDEEHYYPDLKKECECMECGYYASCDHTNLERELLYSDSEKYVQKDEEQHRVSSINFYKNQCADCETYWEEIPGGVVVNEYEDHWFINGVCPCGFKNTCEHKNVGEWEVFEDPTFDSVTEKTHTAHGDIYAVKVCTDCDETLFSKLAKENASRVEDHWFENGKCECGYKNTCEHKTTEEWEFFYDSTYADITDSTHTIYGDLYLETSCSDCEEILKKELIKEDTSDTQDHWYDSEYRDYGCVECGHVVKAENCQKHIYANGKDGVCMRCGTKYTAAKPTSKPTAKPTMPVASDEPVATATPAPTTTPEPVFTEVPTTEVVNGVKAEDETEIAETMITVAEALEAEGEQVSIEIVNIEKVITVEEKAALDTLPLKEQLLTFLSVIGFEEQVNSTLDASGDALSDEATQLKASIMERVNAMDEEARAEFENTLLESFPRETIVIEGQEHTFFVMEIEVRRGDDVRIERYGFRREGEEWIFTKLEVCAAV